MTRQNSFALLGDEEGDDVTTLIANVAAKVATLPPSEKNEPPRKNQQSSFAPTVKFPSKPLPPAESVKADRGRGRGGRGRGSGRVGSGGSDAGQFRNGRTYGYQRNYGDSEGNAADDSWRGRGRGRGGRGRGRGFNEDRGFRNEDQVHGGSENQGQGGDGWEEGAKSQDKVFGSEDQSFRNENRPFRNENRNAGGERRGYGGGNHGFRDGESRNYGDRDGTRYGRGEGQNFSEKKEEQGVNEQTGNNWDSNNGVAEWNVSETTEVPKDVEPEQGKSEQVVSQDTSDKKVSEKEDNEMTLDEYEKLLFEKRKALEALKTEERTVTLDKEFELMKLVEKKKEEDTLFIKLKSEKDKLKRKDSLEKEEKVRKSVSITEFLKPVEGEKYMGPTNARGRGGRGRGRGDRGGFRGGFSERLGSEAAPAPSIQDPGQFPVLGGAVKA